MMKYLWTLLLLLLPVLAHAQLRPVGTHSWHDSTSHETVHAVGSSIPINYQESDDSWERIDSRWEQINDTTWRVVKGNHKTYAFADGRAYYVLPRKGVRHAIGTNTRRLIKFNKSDSTWSTLFTASIDSVTISQGLDDLDPCFLTFHDIFPGVDKVLIYDRGRYVERYVFHQEARDSLANRGPWANHWLGTATKLDLDSLNLNLHDSLGQFNVGVKGRLIRGWLKCQKADTAVFALSREYLWAEDTLVARSDVVVRKWVVKLSGKSYLVEMFNPVPTASWAEGDIWHDAGFGSEEDGATTMTLENYLQGSVYECPTAGTGDSIKARIYVTASSKSIRFAIYDFASDPNFIDSTDEGSATVGSAWYTLHLQNSPSLNASTEYSLVAWSSLSGGDCKIWSRSAPDSTWNKSLTYSNQWPSTVTGENRTTWPYSIYCYYTEGAPPEAAGQIIFINQ